MEHENSLFNFDAYRNAVFYHHISRAGEYAIEIAPIDKEKAAAMGANLVDGQNLDFYIFE